MEGTYKDGKWEGLWTGWHSENGQKMFEGTYKKGKKVSAKYWNIEGIEVENLEEAQDYPMGRPNGRWIVNVPAAVTADV